MSYMDSKMSQNGLLGSESDSQRTLYPYVTGTSVVALKCKDGILMAADMGGSYGSTLRYKTVERMKPIGKHSLLGASGEISDFQEILRYLDELILYDNMWDDGISLGPKEVHNYLTRVMYNRRNKFNPLWNSLLLGGVKNGKKYLGMVNMIGVNFEDNHVATGFGNHLARPILCDEWLENLSFEDGVKLLEKCMLVLLYRDRSAVNKLQIAKITEEGVTISPPYALKTFWGFLAFHNPTDISSSSMAGNAAERKVNEGPGAGAINRGKDAGLRIKDGEVITKLPPGNINKGPGAGAINQGERAGSIIGHTKGINFESNDSGVSIPSHGNINKGPGAGGYNSGVESASIINCDEPKSRDPKTKDV